MNLRGTIRNELPNMSGLLRGGGSYTNPPPNDLYIPGLPKNIEYRFDAVGNNGSGLDTLHSYTLPAGSLRQNGDYLDVEYAGFFVNNSATTKRVVISFGGQILSNPGLFDITTSAWYYKLKYTRLSSTSIIAIFSPFMWGAISATEASPTPSGQNIIGTFRLTVVALSDMDANDQVLLVQGETSGINNNEVVQEMSRIDLVRF